MGGNPCDSVGSEGPSGKKVVFKIKKSTPLRKLMEEYIRPIGLRLQSLRFFTVNHEPVRPEDTAAKLGLKHDETILFYIGC